MTQIRRMTTDFKFMVTDYPVKQIPADHLR
jgi:hypothetical protein